MLSVSNFEYSQGDLLGHGAFALVFKGRRKKDHLPVAIKQIALKSVPGKLSSIRQKEITILKDLKNAHTVQLFDYLETPSDIFLVMEYCNGGDLGDYLIAKKTLSENSIRHLCRHIAQALEALFKLHIIHRDIKPQNLLLSYPVTSPSSSSSSVYPHTPSTKTAFTDATVKLADFGFARYLTGADMAATLCGSPLYMAPEILMGQRYDNLADLWSVGTILYQCLSGSAPFLAGNPHALRRRYEREKLVPKIPEGTSHYLSDLLIKLLKKNPKDRLSHAELFKHKFLQNPSSSDPMQNFCPSQTVKSSPVPIKRQPNLPPASPHHSVSPRQGSSVDMWSCSPSSGPPLSHRVGSQVSLHYYSIQSPNTDVTDQGFILVDFPGGPNSRRCSTSSSGGGGGGYQSSGRSSGRNSVPSHTYASHTPSPASGSLSRYTSLTTPFYQAPPPLARQSSRGNMDTSNTPVNKRLESPQAHSGTNTHYNGPGSTPGLIGPSPPGMVPFGRLVQPQPAFAIGYSPMSNVSSNSYSSCRNRMSPATSPLSTPPSSSPSTHPLHHGGNVGTKGGLSRRNSGSKLSALAEERERKTAVKKGSEESSAKTSSGGFDIITRSCLLDFSEDENEDDILEEENFPLSLNMSFNSSHSNEGEEPGMLMSGNALQFMGVDAVHYTTSPVHPSRPKSSGREQGARMLSAKTRRAASFSHPHSPRLSQQLADLNTKASSLSAHGDPFDPSSLTSPTLTSSPSAEIVNFKVPFVFSDSSPSSNSRPMRQSQGTGDKARRRRREVGERRDCDVSVCFGTLKLVELKDSLMIAEEMQAMAKARQGPILLMSTSADLSDSGFAGRQQRCSEQLVLYAKAVNILDSISTRYEMEMALANYEEPPEQMKRVLEEARSLQKACLQEAKEIRQEVLANKENSRGGFGRAQPTKVSAEKLLFLEAMDICKGALLDEKSVEEMECVKRYRRARTIFKHLLLEAHTDNDKHILERYIQSAQARITHLLS